eukprot:c6666_g1_i1.p1 GENE.c6666_g1_i1~~c6666_g1_i1.p1  ORF type:complete len:290 (+),score=41.58 c6666_g1_i1:118-870(+)
MSYVSMYALSIVCLVLGAFVLLKQSAGVTSQSNTSQRRLLATGFIFFGFAGFSFATGWTHEYYRNWDVSDSPNYGRISNVADIFQLFVAVGIYLLGDTLRVQKGVGLENTVLDLALPVAVGIIDLVLAAFVIQSSDYAEAITKSALCHGFMLLCMFYLFVITTLDIIRNGRENVPASRYLSTAVVVYVSALVIQLALLPICKGTLAFKSTGCPLPDNFNHNAVFNFFTIIVAILLSRGVVEMVYEDMKKD